MVKLSPQLTMLIVTIIVVIGLTVYRYMTSVSEGFYPVTAERIALGESAKRRYNDFADTQQPDRVNAINNGVPGDTQLQALLRTPSYEGDKSQSHMAAPNYDDEFKYKASPELTDLLSKVSKCESITSWDCSAFDDPEFQSYCGICTKDGKTRKGKDHIGGLYISPEAVRQGEAEAARTGKPYVYTPSVGVCKGEFIRTRPHCNIQKDRYDCSVAQSFDEQTVKDKCALCLNAPNSNTFVYINDRHDKSGGYGLKNTKQILFPVNLRLCLAQTAGAELIIRDENNVVVATANSKQGFLNGSDTALFTLQNCYEGKKFTVRIRQPQYKNYVWTAADTARITGMTTPTVAKLVSAKYGPNLNDYTKDDERAKDVTAYIKSAFGMNDCSKYEVKASNDALGGDPTPGIAKQLRLIYSNNGTDFAYAYAREGATTKAVGGSSFNTLCPTPVSQADAEETVCQTGTTGTPTNRAYVRGDIKKYYGATPPEPGAVQKVVLYSQCNYGGKATELPIGEYPFQVLMATGYINDTLQSVKVPPGLKITMWEHEIGGGREVTLTESNPCLNSINYMNTVSSCRVLGGAPPGRCVEPLPKIVQGMVGMWESFNGRVKRNLPLNRTVTKINGLAVSAAGPPVLGTIKGSKYLKNKARSTIVDLPDYLFWFWSADFEAPECEFTIEVPATLRDPSVVDDMTICPSGPLIQTKEAATKLQASPCEVLVDGKPQGPGTYTTGCVRSLFLASGCTAEGTGMPTTSAKALLITKDQLTGTQRDIDDIISHMNEIHTIARTRRNVDGTQANFEDYSAAAESCLGKIILDPCDSPAKLTGPHTTECLDYLFRNAGNGNENVGSTYDGVTNRSSGSNRTKATPIMYCQRNGTMSPIGSDGKPNLTAIQTANSKGGLAAVKAFYKQIHTDANFNTDRNIQKTNLLKCYGVAVNPPSPPKEASNTGSRQNPNLLPNIGGPSWEQGVVNSALIPANISANSTYTVGKTSPITIKTRDRGRYLDNDTYFLGDIVVFYSDATSSNNRYLNLSWTDTRGPAYAGSYMSSPDADTNVWKQL